MADTVHTEGRGTEIGGATLARWGGVDWGAILAAVVTALALTLLLSAIGAAIGVSVADEGSSDLATGVAIWGLIATVLGTFLGAYVGGALMRWGTRFSSALHGIAAWSFALIVSIWLGVSAAAGIVGAALQSANVAAQAGVDGGDVEAGSVSVPQIDLMSALEQGSWWLVVGLVVSLILSIAGWSLGAKTSPVDEGPA